MNGGKSSRHVGRRGGAGPRLVEELPSPVDNPGRWAHSVGMASSERVQRALAAASELSAKEREELITELVLTLDSDREPEPGYDAAWSAEIRRRVDAVVSGKSQGLPWSQVRREIAEHLAQRRRSA
jgi:putative addiction module component (TIGR02574 family)